MEHKNTKLANRNHRTRLVSIWNSCINFRDLGLQQRVLVELLLYAGASLQANKSLEVLLAEELQDICRLMYRIAICKEGLQT